MRTRLVCGETFLDLLCLRDEPAPTLVVPAAFDVFAQVLEGFPTSTALELWRCADAVRGTGKENVWVYEAGAHLVRRA